MKTFEEITVIVDQLFAELDYERKVLELARFRQADINAKIGIALEERRKAIERENIAAKAEAVLEAQSHLAHTSFPVNGTGE